MENVEVILRRSTLYCQCPIPELFTVSEITYILLYFSDKSKTVAAEEGKQEKERFVRLDSRLKNLQSSYDVLKRSLMPYQSHGKYFQHFFCIRVTTGYSQTSYKKMFPKQLKSLLLCKKLADREM